MVRALGVIPARFASTRFPGKPLAPLGDRTILEEVWTRARAARRLDHLVVATEDDRIVEACRCFGAEVMMTSSEHTSGSDRVAEIAMHLDRSFSVVLNIQGDEPLLTPTCLDLLVRVFEDEPMTNMATLAEPLDTVEDLFDPNTVKVVTSLSGQALYFSRSPIPYLRSAGPRLRADFRASLGSQPEGLTGYQKHQGIYAYRRETLLGLTRLPTSLLERYEGLEQLRALQAGISIRVLESDFRSIAVDTPADLERAATLLAEMKETRS